MAFDDNGLMSAAVTPSDGGVAGSPVRPETAALALFGDHVLDRRAAVSTVSVVSALGRLGIGEAAVRTALSRMGRRGLLRTVRQGRQAFLGLTEYGTAVLRDGQRKLDGEVVDRNWDGRWTLLTFSVPESRRADRHALRTSLGWFGFGPLRSGLWVSTSDADVSATLAELDLLEHAEVFRAEAFRWTDPARIAAEAWDLPAIAAGYENFLSRWADGGSGTSTNCPGGCCWTRSGCCCIRRDPVLPSALLPDGWPGTRPYNGSARCATSGRNVRRSWPRTCSNPLWTSRSLRLIVR